MNTRSGYLRIALYGFAALLLTLVVVMRLRSNKETAQKKIYHYDKEEAITVLADTLRLQDIRDENAFTGTFEPNRETKISSEVAGKINTLLVDVGSQVSRGQTLLQLDNALLKLQLQSVEVQIEGLQSDVNRYTVLTQADAIQGVHLEKATLGLKSAKVQRATLLEQIAKSTIRAPFNGIVTAKLNEEGAFAAPGIPLLQITDIGELKFTVNVPERDLVKFNHNQTYQITADAYPGNILSGRIVMIGSKANTGNSFPVQFMVKNSAGFSMKSGMFGRVELQETTPQKGIIVPSAAITGDANRPGVYLVKNGRAVLQNINVARNIENKSVVYAGLQAGDILITNGFINLYDGANVIIK